MQAKIWIVAPFDSMKQTVEQIFRERSTELTNCDIRVSTSNAPVRGLQGSLDELKKAREWGAEAIVSRGGTATFIAERTDIPVVEIQVTSLDILQAFRNAGADASKVGIAGFRNITYECESLYDYLGIHVRQILLHDDDDLASMKQAVDDGIEFIVGDAQAVRFATILGRPGFIIDSGKAAIFKSIKEAEVVVNVRRREQTHSELLRTVIDSSTDGIVAIDDSARITLFNRVAEELFRVNRNQVLGMSVSQVIPNTRLPQVLASGEPEVGEIQRIDDKQIATKRIPIKSGPGTVGVVATFQEVSQLQRYEQSVRQKLHEKGLVAKGHIDQIVGTSEALRRTKALARKFAKTDSTVIITGESGCGKELFAQSIHNLSDRRFAPFVAINCAALPENLLESELFGYEEGAFSGAKKGGKIGLVELAHGGTLLLDEIGEMPLSLQARILRVIQEKEVMRLGGHRVIPVNVRILAATNQNLGELVGSNRFREDLYYRINVLPLQIPPLRERIEDVGPLTQHFLNKTAMNEKSFLEPEAMNALQSHQWPGNVRELANIIERLVLMVDGPSVTANDIEMLLPGKPVNRHHDLWKEVDLLHTKGWGAKRIAHELAKKGLHVKFYQISYYLSKKRP